MPHYDIRPLQLHLLDMLTRIDRAFQACGLRYYLVDGSLLGAVREGGFIPWDDDVDIALPRKDYEWLTKHAGECLPAPLEFVCFENDPDYPQHFGKIQDASTTLIERPHLYYLGGAYVDVFPIDGAPASRRRQRAHCFRYHLLRKLLYFCTRDPYRHGRGPSSWLPLIVRKLWPMPELQRRIKREMTRYDFDLSPLVGVNLNDGLRCILPKEKLGAPTPATFEGRQVMGMADNHYYLSRLFGDYMTPPPPGKRHQHNFHYLDLDLPYREYRNGQEQTAEAKN